MYMSLDSILIRSGLLLIILALLGYKDPTQDLANPQAASVHKSLTYKEDNPYRNETRNMFYFAYDSYMMHAFPRDDLRPLSCHGSNPHGGIAITLLDSLDTLIVMNDTLLLQEAVEFIETSPKLFDVDARVHVFELTIRALGGLLSAHWLIEQSIKSKESIPLVPNYDGGLLDAAVDLADRLLPAFDTPTGIPLSWVNLHSGQIPDDTRETCTACSTTLLLEFGLLSRLTGDAKYEDVARHAVAVIYSKKSRNLKLVGNTIDVDTGKWVRQDSGIGAGIDSFYEYLLKSYLAFGDEEYLDMFTTTYASAMTHMQLDSTLLNQHSWLVDVHMKSGRVMHPYVSSLSAFWPGMQALAGQLEDAVVLYGDFVDAWRRFGWTPEMFHSQLTHHHPSQVGYPLRPELIESTFFLYAALHESSLLDFAVSIQEQLQAVNQVGCGYAAVKDVSGPYLDDSMESFFISETLKYLYLLFSNATEVLDHFVLSTEGHFLPAFRNDNDSITNNNRVASTDQCSFLCNVDDSTYTESTESLRESLPWLPIDPDAPKLLYHRRCKACKAVSKAVEEERAKQRFKAKQNMASSTVYACEVLEPIPGMLTCSNVWEISYIRPQSMQMLPANIIFLTPIDDDAVAASFIDGSGGPSEIREFASRLALLELELQDGRRQTFTGMLSTFAGPGLLPGCNSSDPESIEASKRRWNMVRAKMKMQSQVPSWMQQEFDFDGEEEDDDAAECSAAIPVVQRQQQQKKTGNPMRLDDKSCPAAHTDADSTCSTTAAADKVAEDADTTMCDITSDGLVLAQPIDACGPITNTDALNNSIAIVFRGQCSFQDKIYAMQAAGAKAVIVINSDNDGFISMSASETAGPIPTIPAVLIKKDDGVKLIAVRVQTSKVKMRAPEVGTKREGDAQIAIEGAAPRTLQLIIPVHSQGFMIQQLQQNKDMQGIIDRVTSFIQGGASSSAVSKS